jgi:hypothetical protein
MSPWLRPGAAGAALAGGVAPAPLALSSATAVPTENNASATNVTACTIRISHLSLKVYNLQLFIIVTPYLPHR